MVLKQAKQTTLGWSAAGPPVRVDAIARRIGDASIESVANLQAYRVLGLVCRNIGGMGPKYTILVDERIADAPSEAEYNITVAEELAHIVIHQVLVNGVRDESGFLELQRRQDWGPREREAKRFARALCMPPEIVVTVCQDAYRRFISQYGFTNQDVIVNSAASCVARACNVPVSEARTRLAELPLNLIQRLQGSLGIGSQALLTSEALHAANSTRPLRQLDFWEELPID